MSELLKRTHMCGQLNIGNVDEEVTLNGWVAKQRSLGGLIFIDLRDKTGIVQITFDDTIEKDFKIFCPPQNAAGGTRLL